MNGVINLYKPKGITSHGAVSALRRILGTRRVGHTGTLDPDATGVLPICVGLATKAAELITHSDKVYRATLLLGITTDTGDITGIVLKEVPVSITEDAVQKAAATFLGESEQVPPMYSAIKKDGQKLCDLARKGIEIERAPRKITVYSLEIEDISLPRVTFRVHCSKGTYIRSLCSDMGALLGCGGTMESLERLACGSWFQKENAVTLEAVEAHMKSGRMDEILTPIDAFFDGYPPLHLDALQSFRVKNGVPIYIQKPEGVTFRVYDENGVFIALSRTEKNEEERICLKLIKGFY